MEDRAAAAEEGEEAPPLATAPADQELHRSQLEKFYTDSGRVVYGGGGIRPDIEIDQDLLTDFEVAIERDGALFGFAIDYAAAHPQTPADFTVADPVYRQFATYLKKREKIDEYLGVFKLTMSDSLLNANADYLKRGIRRELARRLHGPEAAYKVAIEADTQLSHALDLFRKGRTLPELMAMAAEWNKAELAKAAAATPPTSAKEPVHN
jgi:carboxyl-terminal processing protease